MNSRGEVYVSEYGLVERVQRFAARGEKFLGVLGHAGTGPGEFNRAEGLGTDSQDRLYVADSCNHRVQVFSSDGRFLRAYGQAGTGAGDFSYPYDICVDEAGRQYVCEFGNSRIQVFDANDQPIETIGGPGTEPGKFNNPWGITLDSAGNLYVADSQNHRVQKLIRRQPILSPESKVLSRGDLLGHRPLTADHLANRQLPIANGKSGPQSTVRCPRRDTDEAEGASILPPRSGFVQPAS